MSAAEQEAITAKRKKAVLDIQEFFSKFAAEIVELQKTDVRGVVMSNQANEHAEWKRAQHCFVFLAASLTLEEKDLLQDWELVLCNMSSLDSVALLPGVSRSFDRMKAVVVEHSEKLKLQKRMSLVDSLESSDMQCVPMCCFSALFLKRYLKSLESVALLPGLQRCFQRVDAFLKEHAEALKKIYARNLDTALRSRHMLQFPMSTFTRLFLGKFEKQLETEQVKALSTWQEHLCVPSAAEQEAIAAKRKKAVLDIQDFLVNFAPEIVQLQKKNLRGVVNCSQAKKHKEWKRAQNFYVRHAASLTVEEKDLLEDWELLLCDVSTLESVALLPGLERCFQRVDSFLREHAEALKRIAAKDLDRALRSRDMAQFPMSTFTRLFLGKFEQQLEREQVRALSTWQEHLCVPSAAEQEAIAAKRKKAVLDIQDFLVNFAPEIVQLQKKNLRGVVNCSQAKKHKEWKRAFTSVMLLL